MKETAKSSGSEAGRVGDPLKSGPLVLASDSGTNFELEDGEWDIGIGDLIIDLDADIEKTNSAIVGGTGIGVMFGSQMATASSAKSPKAAGSVPIPIQSSSTANQSSAAAANSGLKMKFKRTKPSPGTRGTEGKLEIVKNADQSHSGILQQQGVDKNRLPPLKKPTTPVVTPQTKKEKGKESPVKTEGRPQFPVNPPIVKVAPTVQQPSVRMPNSVNTTKPVVPVTPTPNCSVLAPVEQKVVAVSQEVLNLNELDESLVKKPKLKRLLSDQGSQPKSPTNESANNQSEASPSVLLQKTDICIGTSVGTMTEPECLGPCEPGTAVTLEGIVWHESEGGVLVVNVTWRGKTYVGTLMDCTRHQWAPPRFCESPQEDLDTRGKPRPKRLRGNGPSTPQEQANSSLYAKLRTTVKGRVTRTATNSGSPLKSEQNGTKRKGTKDIEANNNANKRSRSNSRGPDTTSPSVTTETAPPVCTSPLLLECPVPNCSKKYKHANGLKFHQDHAHNGDEVEQAKCDSEVESVLDSASRRSTPVISDRKDIEVPAESSESEKPLEMNVEIGADSKTIIPQLPILAAVLEENKSSRAASGSPVSKVPADPLASGSSPAVLSTTVVPAMPVLVGVQEQDTLQEEENELLENKQVPEKPPEVLGPSEPPVLATSAQQPPLSEDGTREDVKSPAYSDISDPNDQAPSIDPEFMETVNKFEEPTEPIRNFGMYSVFNHQTPFLVENSKPEPSAPKPDSWVQERKAELVKEIPKEDSFVSVTNAQYFQPLFIPPEFPPRGVGQQNNESGQYVTDKRPQIPSGDLKLQSEVSKDLSLKDVGIPLSLGPPLPNPLTHVQNMVKHKTEKEERREMPSVIHDFRTEGPPRVTEPIPLESIKHHEDKKKSHPSKPEGFPEYHHDKNGKLPKPIGSNSLHRSTMSPSASGLHRSTISPNPKHVSKLQSMDRRDDDRDKDSEDKHEHKTSHHYEGVKPTMETQGPPPPTGQPTSLNYPYLFPQYHLPFDTFRSPGPLLLPSHFAPSGSLHSPSFMHPGHPNMQHMNPSPNHLRFPSIHMMNHSQEELARVQHSMDFLQHHAQHQFYPMNPPHSQSSINLSNSHKIHELSERAMKSPNTSNSVPKEVPSYHSQSPSDRVMPPSSLPQSAKPQMPPPGSSPFMMGGGLGFPPHQFVPTSMSGAPSPFTPGKPIFRP